MNEPDFLLSVYRRRARELATRVASGPEGPEVRAARAVLRFALGKESFALPLADLSGIAPLARWTPVPGAPAGVVGVVAHGGRIRSVVDLAVLLGLPQSSRPTPCAVADGTRSGPATFLPSEYILFLRRPGGEIGLAVGPLAGIVEVGEAAPCPGSGIYLEGLVGGVRLLRAAALRAHPLFTEAPRE
jgi:chemotaxis signal transduction protein